MKNTVIEGTTSIDQSVMTGESIPVDKTSGDSVSSGTVNQFGAFTMRADAVGENSALQRMVRLAREAEENKAPIVSAADRWATWLVLIALAEQSSEHPLGKAICRSYEDIGGKTETVSDFHMIPGQGVSVTVDGMTVLVGKTDYMRSAGFHIFSR